MASTSTSLMTVEEFLKLPEDQAHVCELRNGELARMTRPAQDHAQIQHNIHWLLVEAAGNRRAVFIEAAFRPVPEHEVRVADVAYAPPERWKSIPRGRLLMGTPDLVVEVLSPSNKAAEMIQKEQICLENGAREFWIVDPEHQQVKISTPEGRTATYKAGTAIPVFFSPGKTIAVDAIFE